MAQSNPTKKKKKVKLKWIVIGSIAVLLIALFVVPKLLGGTSGAGLALSDTADVALSDMESSISASGTVESAQSTSVYSKLSYSVMEVHVEVGDSVKEGDLLAELDPSALNDQITSQKLALGTQQKSGSLSVQNASDNYNNFKSGIDDGLNSSLLAAQSQLDSAKLAYDNAVKTYERFEQSYKKGENSAILGAESGLNQAENAYDMANAAYNAANEAYEAAEEAEKPALKTKADTAHSQLVTASAALDTAQSSYNAAVTAAKNTLEDYQTAVDTAKDNYEKAQKSLEATQKAVNEQLAGYSTAISSASITGNTASSEEMLAQLERTLEDTKIKAPCSGTVTAVYATVGASGAGLLFVIEDVDDLIVKTTVKGYDIGTVQEGQKVRITSDATGESEFEGVISHIAPTAQKDPYGKTTVGADPLFDTEVEITSQNTGLRIGMEAQLDFILQQQENALAVSYDAIYQNENGESCVLIVEETANGQYTLHEAVVETGMNNDLDIVISGEEIKEGTTVVTAPSTYRPFIGQTLSAANEYQKELQRMMG